MDKPLISIIVPVYNVAPYVEDCIRSVMRQTYDGPLECIVVDDCGTDDSMTIIEKLVVEYIGPITFKILHHTHNRGLSAARNTGMDAVTGDYLFFLDSDDELTDDCIKILIGVAKEDNKIEIVQGNTKQLPEKTPDSFNRHIGISHVTNNDIARSCYYRNCQLIHNAWNKLIRRSFIMKNKLSFKDGLIYEDVLWTFFILKYAQNIYFVSEITYYYKVRPDSISKKYDVRSSAIFDKVLYYEILNNLTDGHENEELSFFSERSCKRYVHDNTPEYDDIFKMFWEKTKYYGFFSCYIVLAVAFMRKKSRLFRLFFSIIRRFRNPSLIVMDIKRIKKRWKN